MKVVHAMDKIRDHDFYCWKCGKINTTVKCSMCIRSYHDLCCTDEGQSGNDDSDTQQNWKCPACVHLQNSTKKDK